VHALGALYGGLLFAQSLPVQLVAAVCGATHGRLASPCGWAGGVAEHPPGPGRQAIYGFYRALLFSVIASFNIQVRGG
jgi:hypothetical protein